MNRQVSVLIIISATLFLAACASSPFATVQMSPYELTTIPDQQLCKTYRFEGFYSGKTGPVVNEVSRRGLDCYGVKGKCRHYGFKEGTPAFARCVMDSEMELSARKRKRNRQNFKRTMENLNPPVPQPVCEWITVYDVGGRKQNIKKCN